MIQAPYGLLLNREREGQEDLEGRGVINCTEKTKKTQGGKKMLSLLLADNLT